LGNGSVIFLRFPCPHFCSRVADEVTMRLMRRARILFNDVEAALRELSRFAIFSPASLTSRV
jgi:hypothetical protein